MIARLFRSLCLWIAARFGSEAEIDLSAALAETPRFKGVSLELGGHTFIVPPLTLGAFEDHAEQLKNFSGREPSLSDVKLVVDLLTAALQRNYPSVNRKAVRRLVDLQTMVPVMYALMGVSGAVEGGEGNHRATANSGTGSPSMPSLRPVSGTRSRKAAKP